MDDNELNALVARGLGWTNPKGPKCGGPREGHDHGDFYACYEVGPDYCHDIKAAWEVVELITKENERKQCGPIVRLEHDGKWHFRIGHDIVQADTAPMAICLAFLKLEEK